MKELRSRVVVLVAVAGLACGGGGDGGNTGPAAVASVSVAPSTSTLAVGNTLSLAVSYADAKGNALSGRSVAWTSSAVAVASVDGNGIVTGASVGSATITATVEGKTATSAINVVPPPVFAVVINERTPVVREGESITLTAQVLDVVGRPLTGRTVTWSSADPTRATVGTSNGAVTGVNPGSVYIRAASEGKTDSVSLRVRSLNTPTISGGAPSVLTPGASATVTGTNFGAAIADNDVLVNGVRATITAASATSLSFTVPAASSLPCVPNGRAVPLQVVANLDTAAATRVLNMAETRTLAVGQSVLVRSASELACAEYAAAGGTAKYLVTAFNYAPTNVTKASFQVVGRSNASSIVDVASARLQASANAAIAQIVAAGAQQAVPQVVTQRFGFHMAQMARDRALLQQLGSPRRAVRTYRDAVRRLGAPAARLSSGISSGSTMAQATGPRPVPPVGTMATFRMRKTFSSSYADYDTLRARAVYVGSKLIIYEDSLAPLARQMDDEYVKVGQEFDADMYPILERFGRPLASDTDLAWNARIIALFSRKVNSYASGNILGFVTICDAFPQLPFAQNGCPSSNFGSYFYGLVVDPNGFPRDAAQWRRYMRSTFVHEAKHITSLSERYVHDAETGFDDTWLEEATAQQASEIWVQKYYGNLPQFSDAGWNQGPRCDYAPVSASCPDPAEGILHHYGFFYQHLVSNETKSILTDPSVSPDPVIYGSSWSFARYVTDEFATDETTFLRAITMVKNDVGVGNIESKTGRQFSEMFGLWSMATLADNYPLATVNDPKLRLRSWNSRDLFASMSANLVTGSPPRPAFPRSWPLQARTVAFGDWSSDMRVVNDLPGGGFAAWELAGTQSAPQVIALANVSGSGPLPANVGLVILRIQ